MIECAKWAQVTMDLLSTHVSDFLSITNYKLLYYVEYLIFMCTYNLYRCYMYICLVAKNIKNIWDDFLHRECGTIRWMGHCPWVTHLYFFIQSWTRGCIYFINLYKFTYFIHLLDHIIILYRREKNKTFRASKSWWKNVRAFHNFCKWQVVESVNKE